MILVNSILSLILKLIDNKFLESSSFIFIFFLLSMFLFFVWQTISSIQVYDWDRDSNVEHHLRYPLLHPFKYPKLWSSLRFIMHTIKIWLIPNYYINCNNILITKCSPVPHGYPQSSPTYFLPPIASIIIITHSHKQITLVNNPKPNTRYSLLKPQQRYLLISTCLSNYQNKHLCRP